MHNYELACGGIGMMMYYFWIGDKQKMLPYESLLLQVVNNISTHNASGRNSDIIELKIAALVFRSYYTFNKEDSARQRNQVVQELKKIGTQHALIHASIIFADEVLISGSNLEIFHKAIEEVCKGEEILITQKAVYHQAKFLSLMTMLKSQLSALNLVVGNNVVALNFANEVSILFSQKMEFQDNDTAWYQYKPIEWAAKVHYITKCTHMLAVDILILERVQQSHVVPEIAVNLLTALRSRYNILKQQQLTPF